MSEHKQQPQELKSQPAVLQAVIKIKRAATGKVEEYKITGTTVEPKKEAK